LKEFFQTHYNLEIEEVELGVKGWNWGKAEVQGPSLAFWIGDKKTFEVPLSDVVNANMPTKNEVSLEFSSEERARGENNPLSSPDKDETRKETRKETTNFPFLFSTLKAWSSPRSSSLFPVLERPERTMRTERRRR